MNMFIWEELRSRLVVPSPDCITWVAFYFYLFVYSFLISFFLVIFCIFSSFIEI